MKSTVLVIINVGFNFHTNRLDTLIPCRCDKYGCLSIASTASIPLYRDVLSNMNQSQILYAKHWRFYVRRSDVVLPR